MTMSQITTDPRVVIAKDIGAVENTLKHVLHHTFVSVKY